MLKIKSWRPICKHSAKFETIIATYPIFFTCLITFQFKDKSFKILSFFWISKLDKLYYVTQNQQRNELCFDPY